MPIYIIIGSKLTTGGFFCLFFAWWIF